MRLTEAPFGLEIVEICPKICVAIAIFSNIEQSFQYRGFCGTVPPDRPLQYKRGPGKSDAERAITGLSFVALNLFSPCKLG
jgi:hypothetical protein